MNENSYYFPFLSITNIMANNTASLVKVKATQSCPTLCDRMDCIPAVSSVYGILQARILEWVAIPFSRDLPNSGIEPGSPALQADSLLSEPGCPQDFPAGPGTKTPCSQCRRHRFDP